MNLLRRGNPAKMDLTYNDNIASCTKQEGHSRQRASTHGGQAGMVFNYNLPLSMNRSTTPARFIGVKCGIGKLDDVVSKWLVLLGIKQTTAAGGRKGVSKTFSHMRPSIPA